MRTECSRGSEQAPLGASVRGCQVGVLGAWSFEKGSMIELSREALQVLPTCALPWTMAPPASSAWSSLASHSHVLSSTLPHFLSCHSLSEVRILADIYIMLHYLLNELNNKLKQNMSKYKKILSNEFLFIQINNVDCCSFQWHQEWSGRIICFC